MTLSQSIQNSLEEWSGICGLDFGLINLDFKPVFRMGQHTLPSVKVLEEFAQGEALCVSSPRYSLYKIQFQQSLHSILVIWGSHPSLPTLGELAVCQVRSLLESYASGKDKNAFMQRLLQGNVEPEEMNTQAKQLRISQVSRRTLFLVDLRGSADENAIAMIRNLFSSRTKDYVTTIGSNIVIVKELLSTETPEDIAATAMTLSDMLSTEAMTMAWISYGSICNSLNELPRIYQEAHTAMEVGRIFSPEKNIFSYERLGIGRLIYLLPAEICEMFVKEVFGKEKPQKLDDETLTTIRTLFENNLNLSETARQLYVHRNTLVYRFEKLQKKYGLDVRSFEDAMTFKLAMMVVDYLAAGQKTSKSTDN